MSTNWLDLAIKRGIVEVDAANDTVTYYLARKKQYTWSDPEESVRAEAISELIFDRKYPPLRINTEVEVPKRTPSDWADIVVFKDDRLKSPYIVVETKPSGIPPSDIRQAIEEGFGNANGLRAPYLIFYNRDEKICWDVLNFPSLERKANIIADVPTSYGKAPKYKYKKGDPKWDLKRVDFKKLSNLFERCHNELWTGGKRDPATAFDEMSKILFAKLFDEQRTKNRKFYEFQVGTDETDIAAAERVIARYEAATAKAPTVFKEPIQVEARKILNVVRILEGVSLVKTDLDAKGRAFETFLSEVFRGRLGQYFTRREIVNFMVDMVDPDEDDLVLDPACGSGGFLLYCMKKVQGDIERDYAGDEKAIYRKYYDFSHYNVYGIEISEKIARVAMMDMVIHEDGHTNIENGTAFNADFHNPNITDERFSIVLTNPPFGDRVKEDDFDKLGNSALSDFKLSKGRKSVKSEVLFVERCHRFLRDGGRLGIVLPDGILSNPSDDDVRQFILDHFDIQAVISLPPFAFRKAGSGMRTSLVFVSKRSQPSDDYEIFMALADHIGYDSTGRPDRSDLPEIYEHYLRGTGKLEDKVLRIRKSQLESKFRLDPLYYYLGPIIESKFKQIKFESRTLEDLAAIPIESGKSPRGGAKYSTGEVPILLVGNLRDDGSLDLEELFYVPEDFYEENKEKAGVLPLDILIAKDGATTGKAVLVREVFPFERCLMNEHLFRIRVSGDPDYGRVQGEKEAAPTAAKALKTNSEYVAYFLQSELGQLQIKREISGGAQGGITKPFVKRIKVPVPDAKTRETIAKSAATDYSAAHALLDEAKKRLQAARKNLVDRLLET